MRGNEGLSCVCALYHVVHSFDDAYNPPRSHLSFRDFMARRLRRSSELSGELFIDNRHLSIGAYLRIRQFSPVEDAPAHSLKITGKHRHNHGTLFGWTPIESQRTADETRAVERQELGLAGALNFAKPAEAAKRFLEIGKLLARAFMGRTIE